MFSFLSEGKILPLHDFKFIPGLCDIKFFTEKVIISPAKTFDYRFLKSLIFNFQKRRKVAVLCVHFSMRKTQNFEPNPTLKISHCFSNLSESSRNQYKDMFCLYLSQFLNS